MSQTIETLIIDKHIKQKFANPVDKITVNTPAMLRRAPKSRRMRRKRRSWGNMKNLMKFREGRWQNYTGSVNSYFPIRVPRKLRNVAKTAIHWNLISPGSLLTKFYEWMDITNPNFFTACILECITAMQYILIDKSDHEDIIGHAWSWVRIPF